jgi:hypothetical protein
VRALLALVVAVAALTGCSGRSCDGLAAMQAERDDRREAHQELIRSGTASSTAIGEADDRLHAYERQVYDLEQGCGRD